MSRTNHPNPNKIFVLAKAALNRPALVEILGHRGRAVEVRADGAVGTTAFPIDYLYEDDRRLFDELALAYERQDAGELDRLWARARQIPRPE